MDYNEMLKKLPDSDRDYSEEDWKTLIEYLIANGLVQYREVASLLLGHLNPSQVGTSVASKPEFQAHYPKGKCWAAVRQWHFNQSGKCADCGTRLELQADHIIPKEVLGDEANTLDNMTLRCRRCNVIKRPSHKKGGKTYRLLYARAGHLPQCAVNRSHSARPTPGETAGDTGSN